MPDPIIPHHEEQRSYAELREQFRAENLQRIRSLLRDHKVPRWNAAERCWDMVPSGFKVLGDTLADKGALMPEDRARALDAALCDPVVQSFGLDDVSPEVGRKLEELAQKAMLHEQVTWDDSVEGVTDHDAPACVDVTMMSDDQLCDYVSSAIRRSEDDTSR